MIRTRRPHTTSLNPQRASQHNRITSRHTQTAPSTGPSPTRHSPLPPPPLFPALRACHCEERLTRQISKTTADQTGSRSVALCERRATLPRGGLVCHGGACRITPCDKMEAGSPLPPLPSPQVLPLSCVRIIRDKLGAALVVSSPLALFSPFEYSVRRCTSLSRCVLGTVGGSGKRQ